MASSGDYGWNFQFKNGRIQIEWSAPALDTQQGTT